MQTRTWSVPGLAGLSALILLLLAGHAAADSTWNFKTINDPALDGIYSDISGDYVLYTGSTGNPVLPNSTCVIQLYSLSTGDQARIALSEKDATLAGPNIDGNYAAWFSETNLAGSAGNPDRIFLYTIPGKNLTTIRSSPDAGWPKISGEQMIWSESEKDAFVRSIVRYDIPTGNRSVIPGISTLNGAGVGFNGKYILYTDADTANLLLYATGTGATTTLFAPVTGNNTREIVFEAVLGEDYVLYRKDVSVERPKEYYSELRLYTISTGKTSLISPLTGAVIDTPSATDKAATFSPQSADQTRVAWKVATGIGDDRILVLNPATMAVSSVSPGMFVDFINLDGRNMTWLGLPSLSANGSIYLGTESGEPGLPANPVPTRAPGFSPFVAAGSLLAGVFLARKIR